MKKQQKQQKAVLKFDNEGTVDTQKYAQKETPFDSKEF